MALRWEVEHWSLTTHRDRLIKISAKVSAAAAMLFFSWLRRVIPRDLFVDIQRLIDGL